MNQRNPKKKILIINGFPYTEKYPFYLHETYRNAASETGAEIKEIYLKDLTFNLNLEFGYHPLSKPEPDISVSQEQIKWADHLVWIYPTWWGTYPALVKGFIDRVFLPGFAFKFNWKGEKEEFLRGKSARLIVTMDTPVWKYKFNLKQPGHESMRRSILEFCGIKPVRFTTIGPLRRLSDDQKEKWIARVRELGLKQR